MTRAPRLGDDQRVGRHDAALLVQVPEGMHGVLDVHALGDVQEVPSGEERRVEGPQLRLHGRHVAAEQEALQQIRLRFGHFLERGVDHSPGLEGRIEPQVLQAPVVPHHHTRAIPVGLHGRLHRSRQLRDGHPLALTAHRSVGFRLEVREVRVAPLLALAGGHRGLDKRLPTLAAQPGEQGGLVYGADVRSQSPGDRFHRGVVRVRAHVAGHRSFGQRRFSLLRKPFA